MKAEDIRQIALPTHYGAAAMDHKLMRELVAQLAELNETLTKVGNVISVIATKGKE